MNEGPFRIEKYIVIYDVKYRVLESDDHFVAYVLPGRYVYGNTLEELRENALWAIDRAEKGDIDG